MKISRRSFLRLGVLAALGAAGGFGFFAGRRPELLKVDVALERLPEPFNGLKIAQITDIHAGPLVSPDLVRRGVDLALSVRPDLILLTVFCIRRNWTFPFDRLTYDREGGNGLGRKAEEIFRRGQSPDFETAPG